ncbi:FG-GAP-like repeat-containing protein [Streptacidiphilus albus]|uniref:FG-GAP-like repeat-containing protein n=1 Tax=Streptacidiphilus albus TaxID=105425 RepID=UPI00054C43D9|nr:FG-GAP-like repeat-containing protein [Streptacidiphilus albus]
MSQRNRRRSAAAIATTLLAAAFSLLPMTGASAATGFNACPRGYVCGWSGTEGTGQLYKTKSSEPTLGAWSDRIRSYWNRSSEDACLYSKADYSFYGGGIYFDDEAGQGATGYDSSLDRAIKSIKMVATDRERYTTAWPAWYAVKSPKPMGFGDLNNDGTADLVARDDAGRLWSVSGTNGSARYLGSGWNGMNLIIRHGDLNGDGREDVLARTDGGNLFLHPGLGNGTVGAGHWISGGWNQYTALTGVGDFTGNGKDDLVGRTANGSLYLIPGRGNGTFGPRTLIGRGFNQFTAIVGAGDLNGDGHPDLIARASNGHLRAFYGNGRGGLASSRLISTANWNRFTSFVALGDATGDGKPDLVGLSGEDPSGNLGVGYLMPGNGSGGYAAWQVINMDWWGLNGIF